jgi:hypothetical protein
VIFLVEQELLEVYLVVLMVDQLEGDLQLELLKLPPVVCLVVEEVDFHVLEEEMVEGLLLAIQV